MRNKTNCPNCGAPITGDKCEFCGTLFRNEAATVFGMSTAEAAEAFNRLAKLIGTGAISSNDVRGGD